MEQEFNIQETKLKLCYQEIEKKIFDFFETLAMEEIGRCRNFIDTYDKLYEKFESKVNSAIQKKSLAAIYFENSNHRNQIISQLEEAFIETVDKELENRLENLINDCINILEPLPETFIAIQEEERFIVDPEDSVKIAFFKRIKKSVRTTDRILVKSFNFPRKLFGFKPVSSVWKQKVPYRNLVFSHYVLDNIKQQCNSLNSLYASLSGIYLRLWERDLKIHQMIGELLGPESDFSKFSIQLGEFSKFSETAPLNNELKRIIELFQKSVNQINLDLKEEVKTNCFIVGTVEHKGSYYSESKVENRRRASSKELVKMETIWHKTFFVLSDDWKLELEIYSLSCLVYKDYYDFVNTIGTRLIYNLRDKMDNFISIVNDSQNDFEKIKSDESIDLPTYLGQIKENIKQNLLHSLIPSIRDLIIQSAIPTYIDSMENTVRQQFEKLSKKRLLVKSAEYSKPVNLSEIESISPYLLVTFEMQPQFMKSFPSLKSAFITFINKLQNEIEEIPEILDFSLETSISHFEVHQNKEEALKISFDGFQRSAKKSVEINRKLNQFVEIEGKKLSESITNLINELLEVTNNENALQIKFRITKAKAIEKAKAIRTDILNRIKKFLPLVINEMKKVFNFLRFSSQKIKEQFELDAQQEFISTEISDYLSDTLTAVNKLPFVYQRLFKIEPLQTFEFFVERENPLLNLKFAYEKWKEEKFAPVVIIGEKGCGKTTLINRFQKLDEINEEVIIIDLLQKPHEPESLYQELINITRDQANAREANMVTENKIVIVDGLERLFYAVVDGFDYIKKTFQLVSNTNKSIFWIFNCQQYSWNYLDRCISASDHFAYHIKLVDISDQKLRAIIKKRNSVSGYNLIFKPWKQEKKIMSFRTSKREQSQEELEKDYFYYLNHITGGNVATALQYWMRSTEKVTDDSIYIKSLRDINLQFIQSISKTKYLTIRSILIHNGLSIEKYAELFRISNEISSNILNQLYNDGILTKNKDVYSINLLIYSQLITYMKKLNLLS